MYHYGGAARGLARSRIYSLTFSITKPCSAWQIHGMALNENQRIPVEEYGGRRAWRPAVRI